MPGKRRTSRRPWIAAAVVVALGLTAGVAVAWTQREDASSPPSPAPTVTVVEGSEVAMASATDIAEVTAPAVEVADVVGEPAVEVSAHFAEGRQSIDDPASPWVVVNKTRPISPERWEPPELVGVGGAWMVPEAAIALEAMRAAAADAGAGFSMRTGYRGHGQQTAIYRDYVASWGTTRADRFSARPGYSEHQTGWSVDVTSTSACQLKECFADTAAGQWLATHAHEYGYIVRYPDGYEDITGYRFEPWHLRYVGVDLATRMHDDGVATLEEFFGLEPAPDYL